MLIRLIRHAPTGGNLRKQYIGSTDQPLSSEGVRLASSKEPFPGEERVYTSGLIRTVKTARLLFPGAQILKDPGLREMDFGIFEGKSSQDLENSAEYAAWLDTSCEGRCPGGEDKPGFINRCVSAFLGIFGRELLTGASSLNLVVHGGTIMAVMSELAEPELPYFDWSPGFCGGYLLEGSEKSSRGGALKLLGRL